MQGILWLLAKAGRSCYVWTETPARLGNKLTQIANRSFILITRHSQWLVCHILKMYHDNVFLKRSITTVCFAHMGINPLTWDTLLIQGILYKVAIKKVIFVTFNNICNIFCAITDWQKYNTRLSNYCFKFFFFFFFLWVRHQGPGQR